MLLFISLFYIDVIHNGVNIITNSIVWNLLHAFKNGNIKNCWPSPILSFSRLRIFGLCGVSVYVLELQDSFLCGSSIPNFRKSCIMVCGIHWRSQFVAFYELGIIMNQYAWQSMLPDSLSRPCGISAEFCSDFLSTWSTVSGVLLTRLYYRSVQMKVGVVRQRLVQTPSN
jgi:hypothetical protein